MPKFQDTCRVTGDVMKLTEHQKRKARKKGEKATIFSDNTHPLIMSWLRDNGYKLSDRRIERINSEEVVIHNQPR